LITGIAQYWILEFYINRSPHLYTFEFVGPRASGRQVRDRNRDAGEPAVLPLGRPVTIDTTRF
jgi:hypothetical protein